MGWCSCCLIMSRTFLFIVHRTILVWGGMGKVERGVGWEREEGGSG